MSIQLREPLRSLRQIGIKPWPFFSHYRQHWQPPRSFVQGNTTSHAHKWPLIVPLFTRRSYTASATTVRSILPEEHDVGSSKSCDLVTKHEKNISELWQEYQSMSKESLDIQAFENILKSLAHVAQNSKKGSKHWPLLTQAYEEFKQLGLRPTTIICRLTMKAYGHMGNTTQVNAVFKEYKRHNIVRQDMYRHYMSALLDTQDLSAAFAAFRDINTNPKVSTKEVSFCLAELVSAYCASKKHKDVLVAMRATDELFRKSLLQDWNAQALDQISTALYRGYTRFFKLRRKKASSLPAEALFKAYVETLSDTNRPKALRHSHLFVLFNLVCHQKDFVPSIKTCNFVLDVQSRQSDLESLKTILGWMQKFNIEPNATTVSIFLRTFGAHLPVSQTQCLYNILKQQDIENPNNKINLDVCKAFIEVFTTGPADIELAKSVVSDLKKHGSGLDNKSYAMMAQGFVKRGEVDQCLEWLRNEGCKDLDSYAVLMEGFLSQGRWDRCVEEYYALAQEFEDAVHSNRRVVKALLTAKFAQDKSHDCQVLLKPSFKMKFTPTTILRIVETLLRLENKNGHPFVSGEYVVKSLKTLESSLRVYLDEEGIGRVIIGLGKRGDCEDAFQLYNWVREGGHQESRKRCGSTVIYRAMMLAATENNDMRRVERAWVDMQYRKRFYGKCNSKELHRLATYNSLLNAFASQLPHPNITGVKRAFRRLIKQNLEPDSVTYNILIKAFVNANNMDAANQIYRKMLSHLSTPPDQYTVNTLLNGWIARKDWTQVESFVQELKHSGNLNMVTFNMLVQNFLRLNPRTTAHLRVLKHQKKWDIVQACQEKKPDMTSKTIWDIFEATTGYSQSMVTTKINPSLQLTESNTSLCDQLCHLDHQSAQRISAKPEVSQFAFVKLFSNSTEADQVTYKLFMKAFMNIGDQPSASAIHQWMQYRLSL
ncbi:uncharacterized protein B0P05DRAFT_77638 [Gilbertella persicaria]|uniref:uncharacterized protein n=1 Tax=Gilbertella persicaria TaxID=101096 RepID=UPI00221F54DE|nr:uncharacterized protein B0P05DRAFT_77638 [Gilbertella persicaria]KAI8080136.1 hypothetical protein B0P05DRAFT_77638 [Gilbertella persicaria]